MRVIVKQDHPLWEVNVVCKGCESVYVADRLDMKGEVHTYYVKYSFVCPICGTEHYLGNQDFLDTIPAPNRVRDSIYNIRKEVVEDPLTTE